MNNSEILEGEQGENEWNGLITNLRAYQEQEGENSNPLAAKIIISLEKGSPDAAKTLCINEADKFRQDPKLVELLIKELFGGSGSPWYSVERKLKSQQGRKLENTVVQKPPKQEIADARDRFMDYIGNAMNGVSGELMLYEDRPEERDARKKRVIQQLEWLFERVRMFSQSDFESTDKINKENLQTLSDFKERVLEDFSVIEEMDIYYHSLVD